MRQLFFRCAFNDRDLNKTDFGSKFRYFFTTCVWILNVADLMSALNRISFVEIRDPDRNTNEQLHNQREDLQYAREGIDSLLQQLKNYDSCGHSGHDNSHLKWVVETCSDRMNKMNQRATELDKLLMESFQLLMSSLSVKDSHTSLAQARRGSLVTILAFIYVTLSFVTSIFGMNVKSLNDSAQPFWVCFAALGAVTAFTLGLWLGFKVWERRKQLREKIERRKIV